MKIPIIKKINVFNMLPRIRKVHYEIVGYFTEAEGLPQEKTKNRQ